MKYLMTFSYDGTFYEGYQVQGNKKTIQKTIETELSKINSNHKVVISASGRTDKGVHANNQKAHFTLEKNIDPLLLRNSLNKLLPPDIYIKSIQIVDEEFHARYDVIKKEYIYKINLGEYEPTQNNYVYQYNKSLNLDKIKEALPSLKGTHDFRAFTKIEEEKENYIRTIFEINMELSNNILIFHFVGNGFLRYMIRNIVGTLINVGEGKIKPNQIKDIIESCDRKKAGLKAPACGLYLNNVYYNL